MRFAIVALGALGLGACLPTPSVSGQLHASDAQLGTWDFHPTACRSGDVREFHGADFTDGRKDIRLIDDPSKGYTLAIALDGDPAFPTTTIPQASCMKFGATVSSEGENDTSGSVDLDCTLADGGSLTGAIEFADCGSEFGGN